MIRATIIAFGAYVGTMCPAPTVALVMLLALAAMFIGMSVERVLLARAEA